MRLIDPPISERPPMVGKLTARPTDGASTPSAGLARPKITDGRPFDPDRIAAITLDILHADETPSHPSGLVQYPHMTFLGRIGLAAIAHEMRVVFDSRDPTNAHLNIHDELTVANPALPHRGTVHITIDGAIRWRCRIRNESHGPDGLDLTQITSTIALALTSIHIALCERNRSNASS